MTAAVTLFVLKMAPWPMAARSEQQERFNQQLLAGDRYQRRLASLHVYGIGRGDSEPVWQLVGGLHSCVIR